jgi:hypothetical protein
LRISYATLAQPYAGFFPNLAVEVILDERNAAADSQSRTSAGFATGIMGMK